MEIEITDQNFQDKVIASPIPVLVDFWAPWCGPCRLIGPILTQVATELEGKVVIGKLNVDENQDSSQKNNILGIPTMKLFVGGQEVEEIVGLTQKENILAMLHKYI